MASSREGTPPSTSTPPGRTSPIRRSSLQGSHSALDLLAHRGGQAHSNAGMHSASTTAPQQPLVSYVNISKDPTEALSSSSSSVTGADGGDRDAAPAMLVATADVESDHADAEGEVKAADGSTNQALRETLKRTLTQQNGTERFLHSLIRRLELDMGMITASLSVLRIDPSVRAKVADLLLPAKDLKETLYILMIADNQVVTLVRPRKHSVHPADLHLLVNTLSSSSLSSTPDTSSWLPICLPKFNANGFLHAYVHFLNDPTPMTSSPTEVEKELPNEAPESPVGTVSLDEPSPDTASIITTGTATSATVTSGPKVGLAIVTADRDGFEKLRNWAAKAISNLTSSKLLDSVFTAAKNKELLTSGLGIPGLRHFVYKSRTNVQLITPTWEEPYADIDEQRRLITLYQIIHDAMHAKSGQPGGPLKLQFIRTHQECILGWITTPFELYIALSPRLPKSAAVGAANAITRWVKKNEAELFLRDAPVF
ncbi:Vacuolar fusion protein mon1 [Tulasnella sp. 403]|nr:Vacuolar fusion protein mon1 [Tulasnella sp. 403]